MATTHRTMTLIKIQMTIADRWAIGTQPRAKSEVKLPVLVDPRGVESGARPYLPVTGLAGALRPHLGSSARRWLGPEPGEFEETTGEQSIDPEKRRGALQFLGTLPIASSVSQRGTTRVDRDRAAASKGSLRTEQWAEPAVVTVVALHEGPRDAALLAKLASWKPVLGRSRSTGLGRALISAVTSAEIDLTDGVQLRWWLFERDQWLRGSGPLPDGVAEQVDTDSGQTDGAVWDLQFETVERVHVGTGELETYEGRNALSALRTRADAARPAGVLTVPGSTWKGVFRHRAETILVLTGATEAQRVAIANGLFGSAGSGRGLLAFSDTPARGLKTAIRRHVAIDRFTGGARNSALVTVLSIPEREQLSLAIRSADPLTPAVRGLLAHVVHDLDDGLIGIGGHATRGYGTVKVTDAARTSLGQLAPVDLAALTAMFPQPAPDPTSKGATA